MNGTVLEIEMDRYSGPQAIIRCDECLQEVKIGCAAYKPACLCGGTWDVQVSAINRGGPTKKHKGCTITRKKGLPKYFGHEFGTNGYDEEGCRTDWCRVDFPDGTWVLCPNPEESVKYIDKYLGDLR